MATKSTFDFSLFFEDHPVPSWICDSKASRFTDVNRAALKLLGYTRRQFLQMKPDDLIHGSPKKNNAPRDVQLVASDGKRLHHTLYVRPFTKSRIRYRLYTALPVSEKMIKPSPDVENTSCVSQLSDTERFALIADHMRNAVLFTDVTGGIVWINRGFEELTGYSSSDVANKKIDLLFGAQTDAEVVELIQLSFKNKKVVQVEIINYTKNGKPYWVEMEITPVLDKTGVIGFMVMCADITRLKVAVQEMLKSQEQLQTIMDYSPADVFVKDTTGRYLFFNESFKHHFVTDKNPSSITEDALFEKDKASEFIASDKQVIETGEPIILEQDVVIENRMEHFVTVKFPMRNADRKIYAVGGVAMKITDLKQMQQQLLDNEERLRTLADNLPDGAIYQHVQSATDNKMYYNYFSSGVESITGVRAQDIIYDADKLHSLIHPEDRDKFIQRKLDSKKMLQEFDCEFRLITTNKELKWIQARSTSRKAQDGDIVSDGFLIDLTYKRAVEEKLRQNEAHLQKILQSMINGVIVVNADGEITYANESTCRILEVSKDQIESQYFYSDNWRLIDGDGNHLPKNRMPLDITLRNNTRVSGAEIGIIFSDGRVKWLSASTAPLIDNDQRIVGAVASFLDVTERKKALAELEKTSSRLSLATSSAGIGIWDWNMRTDELVWDDKMRELFCVGLQTDKSDNWTKYVHPDDLNTTLQKLRHGIHETGVFDAEYRIVCGDKIIKHIHDYSVVRRDTQGRPVQMIGICRDVTRQKEFEQSLFESENQLRLNVKEKEILIKEIHHRVKNNLQLISSIIYLKTISLDHSDFKTFLENTREKIKSIALIHERLLQSETLNQVEISDYLGKLLIDIHSTHQGQDVDITITSEIEPNMVALDTAIYCGLIVNELVTNALKHAFKGRRNGTITVRYKQESRRHSLQIADNGISMPDNIIPGETDSFGLQMLNVFIKQINGCLTITRKEGTTFLVEF